MALGKMTSKANKSFYLRPGLDDDVAGRLEAEPNMSAVVQAALRLYYDRQDVLQELARAIARVEGQLEQLVRLLEKNG